MITLFLLLFISPAVRGFGICATFDRIIALKPHKNFETAMPFLWKYCKKAKSPTAWCYENKLCGQYTWAKQYPTCAGSKQSPINIPLVSVYSASGELTSPGYPATYFPQPAGCTKDNMEVAEGFQLAMKLKFQTQCCADYTTWKDDLITVSDGNHTVLFNQTAGFRLNTEDCPAGEVLFNSVSHSASLEFCKYLGVNEQPGYNLSYQAVLQPLSLSKYDQIVYGDLENTGSVAKLHLSGGSMSGGPLDKSYDIKQIHFHWGTHNIRGSEHLLNGKSFPLEMHLVHLKGDDIAVAGFFFEIDNSDNDDLQPLLDLFPNIKMSKAKVQMKNFALTKLLAGVAPLGAAPTTAYSSYTGSLTTPPCTEGVKWVNFLTPLKVSVSQMETFRTLLKADGTAIKYNYRGVQLLNSRTVTKIDDSVPAPHNLDYTPSTDCVKKVVTGDYFDARFQVANIFESNETQPEGSYWLGPSSSQGSFILDFGCQKQRSILEVVNVHNGLRATKKFRVFSSSSYMGPWTELVDDEMAKSDSLQTFSFTSTSDQFYKFEILDWYGNGGGLQYFDVKDCSEGGHCSSAEFFTDGFDLTINGTVEFLRGPGARTSTSYVIYTLHLSGEVTGERFWVGLTKKCSVKPLSDHFLARNINKNLLNTSWVKVDQISGFSFDISEEDLYLLDYYVVVINEDDKVVGCTTGSLSTGSSPAPPTQVILVTGGDSDYAGNPATEVEIYNPHTGISCDIGFNLTLKNHAQMGVTICGGFEGNSSSPHNCSRLSEDEEFETLDLVLSGGFFSPALSWASDDGFVVCDDETCDLVKSDDTVEENWISFYPKPEKSCIVADSEDDSMILIGGEVDGTATWKVGRYDKTGKVGYLPDLIYPRASHGCAGYRDSEGKLVVLVAGGVWPGDDEPTDKTELLLDPGTATAWQMAKSLPNLYDVLTNALITVDNVVYLLGGNATTDVLEWNGEMKEWKDPGSKLNTPRVNHAVGAIPYSLLDYCE